MTIDCRICGVPTARLFAVPGARRHDQIDIYYCRACEARYSDPPVFDYDAPDGGIVDYYESHRDYIEWRHGKIFEFVESRLDLTPGRFLDIGSGAGYSLRIAENRGWDSVGIEPSKTLTEYARTQSGANLIHGLFSPGLLAEDNTDGANRFDYILLDNVLEHIHQPREFLRGILPLLRPNGILLIAVPPVDWLRLLLVRFPRMRNHSPSAQLNLYYDTEQHVNYFSRRAMRILLRQYSGAKLLDARFHHSQLLHGTIPSMLGFETGYYFVSRN